MNEFLFIVIVGVLLILTIDLIWRGWMKIDFIIEQTNLNSRVKEFLGFQTGIILSLLAGDVFVLSTRKIPPLDLLYLNLAILIICVFGFMVVGGEQSQ